MVLINFLASPLIRLAGATIGIGALVLLLNPAIAKALPDRPAATVKPLTSQSCPIGRANYTAIGNPELSLEFAPLVKPAIASEIVSFHLKHKTRGTIVTYSMSASNGYATLYLRDVATSLEDDRGSNLRPVFFDVNWKYSGVSLKTAPQYFFVSGLGSNDWYADRAGNRNQPVGEVIWQFSHCAK